jgi:hypothetical protein
VPPRVRLAVIPGAKFVPSISIVVLPALPPVKEVAGVVTLRTPVCVAVIVNPAVAAFPEMLCARM